MENTESPVDKGIDLSVIVPAYNEEQRLPKTLRAIGDYLERQPYDYEIIAVNDGSKDGTARAAGGLIGKIDKLKLIDNKINHGKGYVTRQGILQARGQIRLFTDSDNSTPIEEVEKLLPFFDKGYDIVIGSRDIKGAKLDPPQPFIRRFLGRGWWLLTSFVVGTWNISDTQCGFKAMTAKAATDILPRCRIDRFAFDPEILLIARSLKYRVKEVGILWKNDPHSTVKTSSMVKMFIDLLRIRLNQIKGSYGKLSGKSQ
jgi:glycosyltransferase involved in cell wall biosynthesis